jgi:probable rRNA maturation factor
MLRAAMTVQLRIEGKGNGLTAPARLLRGYALRMLRALELDGAELSLLVCDDLVMRRINREHRRIDKPTDVLAFAMREGPAMISVADPLGDIVIAWPTARRQAREHGWSAEREVCLLLAHGLLHLLGFDHVTRTEERRMMARAHLLMAAALNLRPKVDKPSGPRAPRARRD